MNLELQSAFEQNLLSKEAFDNISKWISNPQFEEFLPEIESLINEKKWKDLEDDFYTRIAIGTGGIRGKIGCGPNSINNRTIGEAAQGLSQFIWDFGEEVAAKGIVVGYDARKFAKEYAEISSEVFAANKIPVFLFDSLRATPEISFAVRELGATAGVMITASHNPRTDNGFKFYWADGGQVVPPYDLKFMDLVTAVTEIKRTEFSEAQTKGQIKVIGKEIDDAYFKNLKTLSLVKSRTAKIVFSPLHGSGSKNVLPLLEQEGFDVSVVAEQAEPDSEFPTASGDLINPEFPEVMAMAVANGESNAADLVIVSDPDADRIGVAAKNHGTDSQLRLFSGDEIGAMLTHFILSQRKELGTLPPEGVVIETYVTTTLISDIAKSFGVKVVDDLLVGFKYIAEIVEKLENKNDFIFAAEQSLGYLAGSFTRDKDAAIGALLISELACYLKDNSKTLGEYLNELGGEYGFYKNTLFTLDMHGKAGSKRLFQIMTGLRNHTPVELAGIKVQNVIDRLPEESRKVENYKVGKTGDQITFILSEDNRSRVTIRPSGTEPIIKFYIQHYSKSGENLASEAENIQKAIVEYSQKFIS